MVFDTCWRYTELVGSGTVSLPGIGKGPFGGGSAGAVVTEDGKKLASTKASKFDGFVARAELITEIGLLCSCCS